MADRIKPTQLTGVEITDHSLEIADLPTVAGVDFQIVSGTDGKFYARSLMLGTDGSFMVNNDGELFYF